MTNDRPVYILSLINYNAYWPIISHLYYMTSSFVKHFKLLSFHVYMLNKKTVKYVLKCLAKVFVLGRFLDIAKYRVLENKY